MTHELGRVTTEYIDLEDRLRLSGEISAGEPEVIWLTQRLMQRLIPVLVQWLERQGGNTPHAEILHSFAQQVARTELAPQVPVQPNDASRVWLASSVGIVSSSEKMCLTFKGSDGQKANLTLSNRPLRQWLGILQEAYIKAGWSLNVWPDWIKEGMAPVHLPVAGLH